MATEYLNFINGKKVPAKSGETYENRNPADQDDLARAVGFGHLHREQPDRSRPHHRNAVRRGDARLPGRIDGDTGRLDESRVLEGQVAAVGETGEDLPAFLAGHPVGQELDTERPVAEQVARIYAQGQPTPGWVITETVPVPDTSTTVPRPTTSTSSTVSAAKTRPSSKLARTARSTSASGVGRRDVTLSVIKIKGTG